MFIKTAATLVTSKYAVFADIQSIALVTKFQSDPEPLVAQSCEVALSVLDRELQEQSFEGSVAN